MFDKSLNQKNFFITPTVGDTENMLLVLGITMLSGICCWGCYAWFRKPSYEELILRRERLDYAVTLWRYPEGGYVPQHKRLHLMREFRRVCRKLDQHSA